MRCPKCGYISFDDLDICKKCHKNIAQTAQDLRGTVFHTVAPMFLQVSAPKAQPRASFSPTGNDADLEEAESSRGEDIREGIDTEFMLDDISLDDIPSMEGGKGRNEAGEEIVLDMDGLDDITPKEEFSLDLDADQDKDEIRMPAIDFGDMDISDLAPPVVERTAPPEREEEFALATEEELVVASASASPAPQARPAPSSPLEDLQLNDLNLDMPTKIVASNISGKRNLPSIKTGTALDAFDVDLGELFTEAKK